MYTGVLQAQKNILRGGTIPLQICGLRKLLHTVGIMVVQTLQDCERFVARGRFRIWRIEWIECFPLGGLQGFIERNGLEEAFSDGK